MESDGTEFMTKRLKPSASVEEKENDGAVTDNMGEEAETIGPVSELIELRMTEIHEKIDRFTQLVSEMLESGKSALKELSIEFEERMILIHKQQMEKWQEEIEELRLLDASNVQINTLLHNAQYLLQNVHDD